MTLNQEILNYIDNHRQEAFDLLVELARIPAPSGQEEKRAAFCLEWLRRQGAEDAYVDEALNVICPISCDENRDLVVYMAHSDVVFPDTEPLPLKIEDGKIFCPGIGDDSANVAALLMTAKYILETGIRPRGCGLLLVVNSCEEGLGNLKGSRKIMETFGSRIREFISLDGQQLAGVNCAVGSKRYRIEIDTEGGHSYGAFGNRNAIAYLASLIDSLYTVKVPEIGKTTYNVGTVSGGTSVNTIAQHAEMLYEFRSDERDALVIMEQHLEAAVNYYRTKGVKVTVNLVGDRPCGAPIDENRMRKLMDRASEAAMRRYGHPLSYGPGSTDCNVPLSMGVPAICVGCYVGKGAHTREEHVEISSLYSGIQFAFDLILSHF